MAPVTRPKNIKTIFVTPAKLIYKKFRSGSKVRTENCLTRASMINDERCSHVVEDIRDPEERVLRDLYIEHAAYYCDSIGCAITEIDNVLGVDEHIWTALWQGAMSRGGALTSSKRAELRKLQKQSLENLRHKYTEISNSLWRKPRISCRHHLDVDAIYGQLFATQLAMFELFRDILDYLNDSRLPTEMYGVQCKFEIRESLTKANKQCAQV
ncbi:hypothetical protein BIW11_05063 [Tropilaelaps mercedesae]|uniref:Uncharacterized protein n=1 Tax=Tropilaelaps mercedesae TaxID=418985 RepID=A0A1V9Y3V0_9ACAR|nr:hypothetical protein BIW11_05063 [Tropilaelaps mercedesae]